MSPRLSGSLAALRHTKLVVACCAAVEACTCALDGFCCSNSWDGLCVNTAISSCMADCS